jgi:hypothetical protein
MAAILKICSLLPGEEEEEEEGEESREEGAGNWLPHPPPLYRLLLLPEKHLPKRKRNTWKQRKTSPRCHMKKAETKQSN